MCVISANENVKSRLILVFVVAQLGLVFTRIGEFYDFSFIKT